jgi:hypothetical protein
LPHGALVEGGTADERIGLMLRDRNPCYLDFWSGWLEVVHHIPLYPAKDGSESKEFDDTELSGL